MGIHPLTFEGSWLTDQGEAHIVLAQVTPANENTLSAGAPRPSVVATIRDLLGQKACLGQLISGNKPAILILPELALGFDDWQEVDGLVRASQRPLILISGFGFTQGSNLNTWLIQDNGPTVRQPAWPPDANPADDRLYNGGWCWVHKPGVTKCVTFLKVTAEQHLEIQVDGLDQGTYSLAVRLDDLIIFPVICSDFLSEVGGQRVVARKIRQFLDQQANDATKVLIVGLLLQEKASDKWRTAILDIARSINTDRVNVCLVNNAHEILALDEPVDRWRDYSGIYIAKGRNAHNEHFQAVRRFDTEQIDGAVIRATAPIVLGGPLRWTFGATGRHIWPVQKDYGIAANGTLEDSKCADRYLFETLRLLQRIAHAKDSTPHCTTPRARNCFEAVRTHVASNSSPAAEAICQRVLFGEPSIEARESLSADNLSNFIGEATIGLKALGALKSQVATAWQGSPADKGVLRLHDTEIDLLVWAYPGNAITMRQTIERWKAVSAATPLIVFRKAYGTNFVAPHKISERRRDIAEPPAASKRTVAEPAVVARVIEVDLDEIDMCFSKESDAEFAAAICEQVMASV